MDKDQTNVKEFMKAAGQETPEIITIPDEDTRKMRVRILFEEFMEYADAMGVTLGMSKPEDNEDDWVVIKEDSVALAITDEVNIVEVADAIADIDYVNNGNAICMGLDMEPIKSEVHRSNMSKFIDGHRRDDGKWVKGPSYSPANVEGEVDKQRN